MKLNFATFQKNVCFFVFFAYCTRQVIRPSNSVEGNYSTLLGDQPFKF